MALSKNEMKEIMQEVTRTVLASLITFLASLLCIPFIGAAIALRQLLKCYLKHHQNGRFVLMSPVDTTCSLETPPKILGYATSLIVNTKKPFDQKDLEVLRSRISEKLNTKMYRKLKYRPCEKWDFCCWEDLGTKENLVDIGNHVKLCPGADSWSKVHSDRGMMMAVQNALNEGMDANSKPTWEVLVIPQVKTKTKTSKTIPQSQMALIVRMHHAYMDGRSIKEFIQRCILDDPLDSTVIQTSIAQTESLFQIGKGLLFTVFDQVRDALFHSDAKIPANLLSDLQRIVHIKFDCITMNRIRLAFKCETLSIFCNALMVALKQLAGRKGLPFPDSLNVSATCMLHLPPTTNELTNFFNVYTPRIPLSGSDLRMQLVDVNKQISDTPKKSNYGVYRLFELCGCLPISWIRVISGFTTFHSITLSTLPIPEQTFRFQGGDVTSIVSTLRPVYGTVCALCPVHYNGSFHVGLTVADIELVKDNLDMAELAEYFREHIQRLDKISSAQTQLPKRNLDSGTLRT